LIRVERRGPHDIHERLKDIRNEMRKWTAGTRGLLRLSPDENRAEEERITRLFEEKQMEREQASGETPEADDTR
jgi:hypothetical protein